jgi:hypothetical protein
VFPVEIYTKSERLLGRKINPANITILLSVDETRFYCMLCEPFLTF